MAKFKIKATATVELEKEITASTKEEAESIFYDDTYSAIMEDADSESIYDISTDDVEVVSIDYKVHVYDIDWDVDEEEEVPDLPRDLDLWVYDVGDDEDFEDRVQEAIEDDQEFCVKNFKYEILETK